MNPVETFYKILLGRMPVQSEVDNFTEITTLLNEEFIFGAVLSCDFLANALARAPELHLLYVHNARIKMIRTLLPKARIIVDLGGANGSIYEMGYPYRFDRITVVDLPSEDRCAMYSNIDLASRQTPNGPIHVWFGSMTDLSNFEDSSADMVWAGQSIEHITEEESKIVYDEVMRILKKNGFLCLDTPNRLITQIHTSTVGGGFIHPEHKIEYDPWFLRKNLKEAGFTIVEERGICEMPNTRKTKIFDYSDFILGNPLPYHVESAYIQFYKCQKLTNIDSVGL